MKRLLFAVLLLVPFGAWADSGEALRCELTSEPSSTEALDPFLRISRSICQSRLIAGGREYGELNEAERVGLRNVYLETFDTERLARAAAGRKWKTLGDGAKRDLAGRVERFVIINLTNHASNYVVESVRIHKPKPDGLKIDEVLGVLNFWKIVGEVLPLGDTRPVNVTWEVMCSPEVCKVTNVEISGWSLVANLPSLFSDTK